MTPHQRAMLYSPTIIGLIGCGIWHLGQRLVDRRKART